jgi:DNA-binding response OmpR family regulator
MAARILVVEDDEVIGRGLRDTLVGQGNDVDWATTGRDALQAASAHQPDLVLLDLGLPDMDGVEVCRRLRAAGVVGRIVMLTARHDEIDVVVGLDAGADDYVTKPFRLAELLARVRAHLRRSDAALDDDHDGVVQLGTLRVDRDARRTWISDEEISLRPKEFDLLALLADQAGRVVTRERIMSEVWDEHWFGSTKTLDTTISALRSKLGSGVVIATLRGVGYRFEAP